MKSTTNRMGEVVLQIQIGVYNLITQAYFITIKIAGLWNEKARKWRVGRVGQWEKIESAISSQYTENQQLIWMHCASLGEFEQGRPVLEAIREKHPKIRLLLTFFSPSGYEIRKNFNGVDWVFYIPLDSKINAERFLKSVRPSLAIFVKYEFWYHYLSHLNKNKIPAVLISAKFRAMQPFFSWFGVLHRAMLRCFSKILVQDAVSFHLLRRIGLENAYVSGDTRVDRVDKIASNPIQMPLVKSFCEGVKVMICGSTWPPDEQLLAHVFSHPMFADWKFILAPHDIQPTHLQEIESKLPVSFCRYSQLGLSDTTARLLLIDNIGLLSSLYQFGEIAYIGGGFGQGIHNTLEPAAFGLPIIFGPKYQKFEEAVQLVEKKGAFAIRNKEELLEICLQLAENDGEIQAGIISKNYINSNKGSTQNVISGIESLLLKLD